MSPDELLIPRIKVIAADTSEKLTPGTILILDDEMNVFWHNGRALPEDEIIKYPHLFKKLEWWLERKLEEMPQYVKNDNGVFKAKWAQPPDTENGKPAMRLLLNEGQKSETDWQVIPNVMCFFAPANEIEYFNYINSQK